ncbi:VOC family protein [Streptomyces acidiscabies]|uniref:VOC family protein n=1 Tax=Streptomyces acidiscabies TaxID=42234 RepID=A0ABU4MED1_9ACTN|nr:VOC family protein [Streptomyces acidiscabies]MDX3026192.1 VOC family protein [Streptomyces acidiscabies]
MATIKQVSLGVIDDRRAGEFWRQALAYVQRPPRYEGDDWIVLEPPSGEPGVPIAMDVSRSPAEDFPRIHFDLDAGEHGLDAEVDRLVSLGARHVDWRHYPENPPLGGRPYVVLADPEGNRFCVEGQRAD